MARDYGSRRPVRHKSSAPQQMLVIAFSFVLGYFTATVFDAEKLTRWMNTQVLASHEEKPQTPKPVAQHAQPPKPKFEFYTLLANEKGVAARGASHHAAPPSHPATSSNTQVAVAKPIESQTPQPVALKPAETHASGNKSTFLVQVASFKMRKDAEQMKALLTLKGYDVNVVAISQAQGNWFRVVVGPYQNKNLAQEAQVTLAKNERLRGMVTSAGG